MLVDFKSPWFGPTAIIIKDKIQSISGRRYKRGVQEVDDALEGVLPPDAIILNVAPKKEENIKKLDSLRDYDVDRTADDRVNQQLEDADKQAEVNKKVKQDRMAKARQAPGARKGNKTVV